MLWNVMAAAAAVYAAVCLFFFVFQRSFIYHPTPVMPDHDRAMRSIVCAVEFKFKSFR